MPIKGSISFTLDELSGVPQDVMSGYKKLPGENGNPDLYQVSFKTPDITPLVCISIFLYFCPYFLSCLNFQFKFASNPETRRRASSAFEGRLAINVSLFDKAMELRRKIAKILGYKTWADYITEVKMVKTAENVDKVTLPRSSLYELVLRVLFQFLDDILVKLKPVGIKDRSALLALKKEEHEEKGYPFDNEFYLWDYRLVQLRI